MSVSCSCSYGDYEGEGDVGSAGDPRLCRSRQERSCRACAREIKIGDWMYMQSFYDFYSYRTASPIFLCEECGDMSLNLMYLGFCFTYDESLKQQWFNYLAEE